MTDEGNRTTSPERLEEQGSSSTPQSRKLRRVRDAKKVPKRRLRAEVDLKKTEASEAARPTESLLQVGVVGRTDSFEFDRETGKVSYPSDSRSDSAMQPACLKCGTMLQVETDVCPICGAKFDEGDSGIVSLVAEKGFDLSTTDEMDCPNCGEHVRLANDMCPECGERVAVRDELEPKLPSIVKGQNVVFVRLSVEAGEVEYMQRLEGNRGFEHIILDLKKAYPELYTEG